MRRTDQGAIHHDERAHKHFAMKVPGPDHPITITAKSGRVRVLVAHGGQGR
jgi:hypothetical protein